MSKTISAVQEAAGRDQVDVAEAGVVVVVVDVQGAVPALGEEVDRHPVDVAAVEEDDGAVGHVGGRLVEDLLQRQEAVLDRQRELLRGEEHHRVLAQLLQQVVHAEQRAEGVAVGPLVGGQQEAVVGAQLGDHRFQVGEGAVERGRRRGRGREVAAHDSSSSWLFEQVGDPHTLLDRVVVMEGQGRSSPHSHLAGDPRLEHPVRGTQGIQRSGALGLVAQNAHENLRGTQVGGWSRPRSR